MRLIPCLAIAVFLFACTDKSGIPSDVISKSKMELILWDMIKADRFTAQYLVRDSTLKDLDSSRFALYESIFLLHGVKSEEFRESFEFYLARPDITKVMFDSISSRANRTRNELDTPVLK